MMSIRAGNTVSLSFTLPKPMSDMIDSACKNENRTRSELVREALRVYFKHTALENTMLREADRSQLRAAAVALETESLALNVSSQDITAPNLSCFLEWNDDTAYYTLS